MKEREDQKNEHRDPSIFKFGNLTLNVKGDFVLSACAMPELEDKPGKIKLLNNYPNLWRGWVVATGPGNLVKNKEMYYNPGICLGDFVYFIPQKGRFFTFHDISFSFVKMNDIELVARR